LRKGFLTTTLIVLPVLALTVYGAGAKLGDESDGSRAVPVHLISLFDEQGWKIGPLDELVQPFSLRQSCAECHSCETISRGWHFNAPDTNVPPGRPGQPWIYVDAATASQIPMSYRPWPGTFKPEQLGISPWQFTLLFGRQTPGGGAGELQSDVPDEVMRQFVSGKLEVNCLSCHNAQPGQDQGGTTGYAMQIARQNFRWAATGSCEFANVTGSAAVQPDTYDALMGNKIKVDYLDGTFGYKDRVLFDIVREVPSERCYFCHSNKDIHKTRTPEKWATDRDVHLAAGLRCVDCHRHGLEHNITRGYEGESSASANQLADVLTCEGCHLGTDSSPPDAGRLGAPQPKHVGIPPIHFEKLACTACHSGPWPERETCRGKTSRAHGLGTSSVNKSDDALPHIIYPVFAEEQGIGAAYIGELLVFSPSGKIAPHKLFWPAFWATLNEQRVTPIKLESVKQTVGKVIAEAQLPQTGDWPSLTREQIAAALELLSSDASIQGQAVYVCGGSLYQIDNSGQLVEQKDHPAGRPCLWPMAHDVRPAAQSLGIHGCDDCHTTDAPFVFGKVEVDSPIAGESKTAEMSGFQDISPFYMKAFAFSFVFRPWLKVVVFASCGALAAVLVFYGLKALGHVFKVLAELKQ